MVLLQSISHDTFIHFLFNLRRKGNLANQIPFKKKESGLN